MLGVSDSVRTLPALRELLDGRGQPLTQGFVYSGPAELRRDPLREVQPPRFAGERVDRITAHQDGLGYGHDEP
jgi:hypothetical protein